MSAPRFVPAALQPTDEQLAIQTSRETRILIEAAAGAAKTTTLALRIGERLAAGSPPQRLLALTFTDTACQALRDKLEQLGLPRASIQQLRIHSVEDYASRVLRHLEVQQGRDPVQWLQRAEQLRPHLWDAIEQLSLNPDERHREALALPAFNSDAAVSAYLRQFRQLKGRLLLEQQPSHDGDGGHDSPDYAEDLGIDYTLLRVLRSYEALRWSVGDAHPLFRGPYDATYDLARLLLAEEELVPLDWLLGRYDELLIDEMHDCNAAMFALLQVFMRDSRLVICAVGDRDQVIHRQHGADARFMGRSLDEAAGRPWARPRLSASYRFGQDLAQWMSQLSNKPIRSAEALLGAERLHTDIVPLHYERSDEGCDVGCVNAVIAALRDWRRQRGSEAAWSESAVLLRHESQSVLLENALHSAGIAYRCQGFPSYLRRPEVLFVRAVYAVASQRWDALGGAATRALIPAALFEMTQTPPRQADDSEYASDADYLAEAARYAADSAMVIGDIVNNTLMQRASPGMQRRLQRALAAVQKSSEACAFADFLQALDMPGIAREVFVEPERRAELQRHMEGLQASAAHFESVEAFFRSLQQHDEANEQRQAARAAGRQYGVREARHWLTLASVEQVKGLEYGHVLLPWLADGLFPERSQALADERNLFYVGATRARQRLSLIIDAARPSAFIQGLKR
ncbi:ATP-dependent helicase [Paucibacter sp. APW11]|uniref:DNA 3'-5' helicase n=1 Tax=Roseateles aquae TaxID=3077235 RepID=A0ABU3P7X4_9BURK|nr:ATP-dependent helicase [Paucibacter sp. APW11]MDT8998665.1 ATP-dependent helicase [Paucibacter sp. APW11]